MKTRNMKFLLILGIVIHARVISFPCAIVMSKDDEIQSFKLTNMISFSLLVTIALLSVFLPITEIDVMIIVKKLKAQSAE